ncbi:MAG: isoamylase early set domain-containing protein [Akkermansiaceae bacterium]|nr:isoamylase early set domain-containing protein [Verrucomicrobiales bacterium]
MKPTLSSAKNRPNQSIDFAFPAPAAREVWLVGDFNGWDPSALPMKKNADGRWHVTVALRPGRHEYRFFADGVWLDDPGAEMKTSNTMGGENCVRIVVGRRSLIL